MKSSSLISLIACFLLLQGIAVAQETKSGGIYTWKDSEGRTHYSSTQTEKAVEADLPELQREDISKKIQKIKKETPSNCQSHGGIDCSKGADADGSVICLDGYSRAVLPFRFYCAEARLEAEVTVENLDSKTSELRVTLRNISPIDAKNVQLRYQYREADKVMGRRRKVELAGKDSLSAYGFETYTFSFPKGSQLITKEALLLGKPLVSCKNCVLLKK